MTLQHKAILGFFSIAFFLEMYACTLPVEDFIGISAILSVIGSTLYLGWAWSMRSGEGNLSSSSNPPPFGSALGFPEIYIPGSAAQELYLLRQDEARRSSNT